MEKNPAEITQLMQWSKFKVEQKPFATGTFGEIYRGKWAEQNVVLKKLKLYVPTSVILKEINALMRLHNKHVVLALGATMDLDDNMYLVMEYSKNGSLHQMLHDKLPLRKKDVLQIGLDVAKGLAYLHENDPMIIHRDIKSQNILLFSNKTRAKLSDFGTARLLEANQSANSISGIGSLGFIAPEIIAGEGYKEKADVYSFGALLFEMVCKGLLQLPNYKGLAPMSSELRENNIVECVKDTELQHIILWSCKQNPDDRPSMNQVVVKLRQMFKSEQASNNVQASQNPFILPLVPFSELKVLKLIGEGGFSEVKLAEWRRTLIALKSPKYLVPSDQFLANANMLMSLRSKFIIPLLGVATTQANFFLIMEYMKHGSLNDLLFKHKIKLDQLVVIQLALDIAKGLDYLHSLSPKVLHRNMNSANIMLHCHFSRAKIAFPKLLFEERNLIDIITFTTSTAMPPELVDEKPYDEKMDVFLFGVVLYEMLTCKQLPILQETDLLMRIRKNISDETLANLVAICCATDPSKRPYMHEVVKLLTEIKIKAKK